MLSELDFPPVEKLAYRIPTTKQQLEDAEYFRAWIEAEMRRALLVIRR